MRAAGGAWGRGLLLDGRALARARGAWAAGAAGAAALWARSLPSGVDEPGVGLALPGLALALVLTHGVVSADVRGGAFALWLQEPGRPAARYAGRLGAVLALVLVGHGTAVAAQVAWGAAWSVPTVGRIWALAATDVFVVALGFAVSSLGLRGDAALTVVLLVILGGLGVDAVVAPERLGAWAPWLAAVRLPALEARAVALWLDGAGAPPGAGAWARALLHPLLAGGAGLAVVEWRGGGLRPRRGRRGRPPAPAPPPTPARPPPG